MAETAKAAIGTLPPQAQLIEMATAYWVSSLLHVAVQLKLADYLTDGSRTAEELAQSTGSHAPALYRVLRTLASLGLFTEDTLNRFSLTALGDTLRADAPGSVRASVLTLTGDMFTRALENLPYSVQTGKTGFEKAFGRPIFDWLADHPEQASNLSHTMVGFHGAEPAAVAAAYDFSRLATLVDVGGATGNLLTTILALHPGPCGILFDMPHVVRDAPALIEQRGLADRVGIESGNFFESVPAGGDVYLLSHIIHDWDDDRCVAILGNCRRAMKPNGKLLIIEMVLPTGNTPHPGKMLDIIMLAIPGGQERTEPQYRVLLERAGFRLARVVPTGSAVSIVEALPC